MNYAILGGGALGLLTAYRLLQAGNSVMLFEQEPLAGGLAAGFQIDGVWLEKFYHHIFRSDKTAIRLIQEVGLGDRLEWHRPRTGSLVNNGIYQLDSPLTLLQFQPWNLIERLRVGVALAALKFLPASFFEGQTAIPWLKRWMGKRPFSMVFETLFTSKFGALAEEIALPWFWARMHDRTTELGYLRGGFQLFYNRLVELITQAGGKVLLQTRVERAEPLDGDRWQVFTDKGSWEFDRLISTFPTRLNSRLIPALPEAYRQQYDWGQAYGAHCLILALDRQVTDSYWINICDPGYPFGGLFEHTNFRKPEEYGGRHLLYLGNYRPMNDPLFTQSKEDVLAQYEPHLQRIVPNFSREWVRESWMFQAPYAQPIVTTDYRQHIPPHETPLANLWIANMFQIYPHDRGQNYSLAMAEALIQQLVSGEARA
jgi:protoporphyrinogen oxidase